MQLFFAKFLNLKKRKSQKLSQKSNEASRSSVLNNKRVKTVSCAKRYCVSRMKLLQSGDIELNPGPEHNVYDATTLAVGATILLNC